jgi:transcriptional regulator with XRE-family HTH domain
MPRPNPPRDIYAERYLAIRVAREREARGWSYEGLASRMTAAGCPLNQSAIYKIERADPPRRITVDELVAYSRVFGIPVEQLLLDPEVEAEGRLLELINEWRSNMSARDQAVRLAEERDREIRTSIRKLVKESTKASSALEDHLRTVFPDYRPFADVLAAQLLERED